MTERKKRPKNNLQVVLGFFFDLEDTSEDYALAMQLQFEEERLYQINHAKDNGSSKCVCLFNC